MFETKVEQKNKTQFYVQYPPPKILPFMR